MDKCWLVCLVFSISFMWYFFFLILEADKCFRFTNVYLGIVFFLVSGKAFIPSEFKDLKTITLFGISFLGGLVCFIISTLIYKNNCEATSCVIRKMLEYVYYILVIFSGIGWFCLYCFLRPNIEIAVPRNNEAPVAFEDEEQNIDYLPIQLTNQNNNGNNSVGLNSQEIKLLKVIEFKECKACACTICLQNFMDGENLITLPQCEHFFHKDCIEKWLKGNLICPICRKNVKETLNNK